VDLEISKGAQVYASKVEQQQQMHKLLRRFSFFKAEPKNKRSQKLRKKFSEAKH